MRGGDGRRGGGGGAPDLRLRRRHVLLLTTTDDAGRPAGARRRRRQRRRSITVSQDDGRRSEAPGVHTHDSGTDRPAEHGAWRVAGRCCGRPWRAVVQARPCGAAEEKYYWLPRPAQQEGPGGVQQCCSGRASWLPGHLALGVTFFFCLRPCLWRACIADLSNVFFTTYCSTSR